MPDSFVMHAPSSEKGKYVKSVRVARRLSNTQQFEALQSGSMMKPEGLSQHTLFLSTPKMSTDSGAVVRTRRGRSESCQPEPTEPMRAHDHEAEKDEDTLLSVSPRYGRVWLATPK